MKIFINIFSMSHCNLRKLFIKIHSKYENLNVETAESYFKGFSIILRMDYQSLVSFPHFGALFRKISIRNFHNLYIG